MVTKAMPAGVELHRGYEPGVVGRIGELHGRYYAAAWGSGAPFEILVSRELCDFVEHYDARKDLLLTAHTDGVMVGSLGVVGRTPEPDTAQLRFVIVDPAYQGRGAVKAMLNTALDWCREAGFSKVFLWTVDHLPESRSMYEKAGFRVTDLCPDDRYTVHRDNLKMELTLSGP
jgi:N-acetylglutamate synthase-like GNAT family acetyltransferase